MNASFPHQRQESNPLSATYFAIVNCRGVKVTIYSKIEINYFKQSQISTSPQFGVKNHTINLLKKQKNKKKKVGLQVTPPTWI